MLYVICGAEDGTNSCHVAVYSFNKEFSHHFEAPPAPTLYPIDVLVIFPIPVKKLSKIVWGI